MGVEINLLDLPIELLEHITHYLDMDSSAAAAVSSCRLFQACTRSCARLRIHTVTKQMCDSLNDRLRKIHILNLSNCHSRSSYIFTLVSRCTQLRELNVVNSGLSSRHLLRIIKMANHLEVLSFSSFDDLTKEEVAAVLDGGTIPLLRKVYVECPSRSDSMASNLSILNYCPCLQFLHINLVGRARTSDNWYAWFNLLNEMQVDAEFHNLQSFVVSCHLTDPRVRMRLITMLYNACRGTPRLVSMRTYSQTLRHIANPFNVTEFLCVEDNTTIPDRYKIDFANPLAEELAFRLPLNFAQHVVELDLTTHHCEFLESYWQNLVESAPNLEALAVPICFIPQVEIKSCTVDGQDDPNDDPGVADFEICDVANILKGLRLKKLLVTGPPLITRRRHVCSRCEKCQNFKSIGDLDQLEHLEEFALHRVSATVDSFNTLANAHVKTIKLCLLRVENVNGLKDFIMRCESLTHFKLEAHNLPLHSATFWEALASRDSFEQICLTSRILDTIDHRMVLKNLSNLTRKLEVLHLHMTAKQPRLIAALKTFFRKLNIDRWPKRLYFTDSPYSSLNAIHIINIPSSFPGRALCCTANLISKIETVGWNVK